MHVLKQKKKQKRKESSLVQSYMNLTLTLSGNQTMSERDMLQVILAILVAFHFCIEKLKLTKAGEHFKTRLTASIQKNI